MTHLLFPILAASLLTFLFFFESTIELLNLKRLHLDPPSHLNALFPEDQRERTRRYHQKKFKLALLRGVIHLGLIVGVIFTGFLNRLDVWCFSLTTSQWLQGLIFIGVLALGSRLISIPFEGWNTFRIESEFGFNRTTVETFWKDQLKSTLLGILLGGLILSIVLLLYGKFGPQAWIWTWVSLTAIQLFFFAFGASLFLPLFSKLSPIPEGELKSSILRYTDSVRFPIQGLFQMDGSKRSSKANAFFSGLGRAKKIVLFDTLIEKLTADQTVAVLAHEVGHYREKHILKQLLISTLSTGFFLWIFSQAMQSERLAAAFSLERLSVHGALVSLMILFQPLSLAMQLLPMALSRKYEFEADRFSFSTFPTPSALREALTRLGQDHLSHWDPHPLKIWTAYTHPPLQARLHALEELEGSQRSPGA